jgi:WD40 repeat protein
MPPGDRPEYGICEVLSGDRAVGLGFAIGRAQVVTCAHVVNSALGRADRRDPAPPDTGVVIKVRFAIGATPGDDGNRAASVTRWLPAEATTFDIDDVAVLELAMPVPAHAGVLRPTRYRALMPVQMWGPQPGRPGGGHVKGELLGEVRGGRIQISVSGGPFRVRPGFSGGPVWEPGTGDVAGMLSACGAESDATDAYLLGTDRITAVWPDWLPGSPGSGPGPWRDLLDEVAEAARYHPDFGDAQITRAGDHLVATIEVRAGGRVLGTIRQPIGVHDGDVTADLVAQFASTVAAHRQSGTGSPVGTLVHTGQPAAAPLREMAARSGVDLRSLAEFQTGVDLRPFAGRQHQDLLADSRYPQQGYVPQRYTEPPDPAIAGTTLIESLLGWLAESDGYLVVVLAPFGHGKTYLLHELAQAMHDRPDYPAIPVLVRLAELERSHHVDELVGAALTRGGERRVDLDRLAYLRREGRIALLLDGFDELARRVSYDQAAAHLEEIVRAAEGRAKVVLTSRREFFLSDADAQIAFGQRLATVAGRRVVAIAAFDGTQIRQFLAARMDPDAADRWMTLLGETGLLDLAANPRMLSLLTALDERRLRAAAGTVTKAWVFEQVLTQWLTGEYERANPYGTQPQPWLAAMRSVLTDLADRLWTASLPYLSLEDLRHVAATLTAVPGAERLTEGQAVHLLGSGTILVRVGDGNGGQFDFIHRTLMEWLIADRIAARVAAGEFEGLGRYLAAQLSPVQISLVDELVGRDTLVAWVTTAVHHAHDGIRGNAVTISQQLCIPTPRLDLSGHDLRGQDLSGRYMADANLTGADLTDADLTGSNLTDADLTGATLHRTRLNRAVLRNAVVAGAALRDARLLGADLRGIDWSTADDIRRTAALAALTDRDTITTLRLAGAAPDQVPDLQLLPGDAQLKSFSIDPSGDLIAVACGMTVSIWDLGTGLCLRVLADSQTQVRVQWSPDGRHLATISYTGHPWNATLKIWDAATGALARTLAEPADRIDEMVFWSPDSKLVAASGYGGTGIWDAASGARMHTLRGHSGQVTALAWSPDSRYLATGSYDHTARTWDAVTGAHHQTMTGHTHFVLAVAWSPDGRRLATGSYDHTARTWDAATGMHVSTFTGHHSPVYSVSWSPDGSRVVTGHNSSHVSMWDAATGEDESDSLPGEQGTAAWSPDGRRLAAGKLGAIHLWDAATHTHLQALQGGPEQVTWSPDGSYIVGSSYSHVHVWNATTGTLAHTFGEHGNRLWVAAWSPDGRRLAISGDETTRIWDLQTGTQLLDLTGQTEQVRTAAWSPDGARLAAASYWKTPAVIWDTATGRKVCALPDGTGSYTVAWSPDGRFLVADGAGLTAATFDAETGAQLRTFSGHDNNIHAAAWSPDGKQIATSGDHTIRLWDPATGAHLRTLTGHDNSVHALAWSPDSRSLVSGSLDDTARVWDTRTGTAIHVLAGHTDSVYAVSFSPDGRHLATAASDGTARIWDADTGDPVRVLSGHTSAVPQVSWSPDGQSLATASWDCTARIWDATTGDLKEILVPLTDGLATFYPDGRYKLAGTPRGEFWWAAGLARLEPGEADPYVASITRLLA